MEMNNNWIKNLEKEINTTVNTDKTYEKNVAEITLNELNSNIDFFGYNKDKSKIIEYNHLLCDSIKIIDGYISNHFNSDIRFTYTSKTFENSFPEKIRSTVNYIYGLGVPKHIIEYYIEHLKSDELPYFYPHTMINNMHLSTAIRDLYIHYRGFTLINSLFINELFNFIGDKKVLEIMSGKGFLSHCL